VIVDVSDTGTGIPPEIVDHVFDAFFTTKEVGAGTGLGLAICQRIITDMDGTLTVESTGGTGTTFRVSLPAARPAAGAPDVVAVPVPAPGRRGRILVVDDEAIVARAVERCLSAEHEVVSMVAARDALALLTAGTSFDLILCDLMMPDMTGMDFHRELAILAPEQAKKMVFFSGGAFTENARQFLLSTTLEQMEKPFDPTRLRALVRRFVQ
jgi:CheY-like chemotaxis protein